MIVGIDPGTQGAIAWLSDDGALIEVRDLPMIEVLVGKTKRHRLAVSVLVEYLRERMPDRAVLEDVGTRPGEGAVGAFSFGTGFGMLQGVLGALDIPTTLVRPVKWKKAMGVPADKGAVRLLACREWPGAASQFARVKDDGRAEACFVALYGANCINGKGQ